MIAVRTALSKVYLPSAFQSSESECSCIHAKHNRSRNYVKRQAPSVHQGEVCQVYSEVYEKVYEVYEVYGMLLIKT